MPGHPGATCTTTAMGTMMPCGQPGATTTTTMVQQQATGSGATAGSTKRTATELAMTAQQAKRTTTQNRMPPGWTTTTMQEGSPPLSPPGMPAPFTPDTRCIAGVMYKCVAVRSVDGWTRGWVPFDLTPSPCGPMARPARRFGQ